MKEIVSCIKNLPKHFLTALQSLWRNIVMSYASIFAVTTTLLLMAVVGAVTINIQDITANIADGVRIFVKLDREIDEAREQEIGKELLAIDGVEGAVFSSKDEQLTKFIDSFGGEDSGGLLESYRGEENPMGGAYDVEVDNPDDIDKIQNEIEKVVGVKEAPYGGAATENMLQTLSWIRTGGFVVVAALVVIALAIIMNTIKLTITSRQTEISIMRLVGASNWYIRLPFMLEGMLIGLIGSIIPIIILIYGYTALYNATGGIVGTSIITLSAPYPFVRDLSLALAGLGALVGFLGSFISVRRFLKT